MTVTGSSHRIDLTGDIFMLDRACLFQVKIFLVGEMGDDCWYGVHGFSNQIYKRDKMG